MGSRSDKSVHVLPYYARVIISTGRTASIVNGIVRAIIIIYKLHSIVTSVITTAVEPG